MTTVLATIITTLGVLAAGFLGALGKPNRQIKRIEHLVALADQMPEGSIRRTQLENSADLAAYRFNYQFEHAWDRRSNIILATLGFLVVALIFVTPITGLDNSGKGISDLNRSGLLALAGATFGLLLFMGATFAIANGSDRVATKAFFKHRSQRPTREAPSTPEPATQTPAVYGPHAAAHAPAGSTEDDAPASTA